LTFVIAAPDNRPQSESAIRSTSVETSKGALDSMFPIQNAVPTRYPPLATWALIAANCAVFLIQITLTPPEANSFIARFALIPARYFYDDAGLAPADFLPFITMMFLHGGWLHLILNMWALWIFGRPVEDRLGPARYIILYFASGILAAFVYCEFDPASTIPAMSASGAIAGVMGCYVRLFPLSRLVVVVPILFLPLLFEVPAIIFVGIWILMQLLQGTAELLTPTAGAGIAWWAHVGGFVAGAVLGSLLFLPKRERRPYYADEGFLGFDPAGRP
jgi:membrane associated rhomboid family serine protease